MGEVTSQSDAQVRILAKAGVTNDADQQAVVTAASQAVTLAGGLIALIGRITATKRIG